MTAEGSPVGKSLGVFIADDSPVIRQRLTELLAEIDGVRIVGEAADVPSATTGITSTRPDVAIVDIRMPGGSGIDVVKSIRKEQAAAPSFIMYTNYGLPQYRQACADAGADLFFDKATDGQKLTDAIRKLAGQAC